MEVAVGQALIAIESSGTASAASAKPPQAPATTEAPPTRRPRRRKRSRQPLPRPWKTTIMSRKAARRHPRSPSIRKIARELGIDLTRVRGSEAGGRIDTRRSARLYSTTAADSPFSSAPKRAARRFSGGHTAATPSEAIDFAKWGPDTPGKMSPLRRTVSRRMVESWTTIPKINQFADADITALLALRKKHAAAYEKNGAHLTFTSFLLLVLGRALKKHPRANASMDEAAPRDHLQRLLPYRRRGGYRRRADRADVARCRSEKSF